MLSEAEILQKSYDEFLKNGYDKFICTIDINYDDEDSFNEEQLFYREKERLSHEWEAIPIDELRGKTPKEFIEGINDLQVLIAIYTYISIKSFDAVPLCLINKIVSYGDEAAQILIDKIDVELLANSIHEKDENTDFEVIFSIIQSFMGVIGFGGSMMIEKLIEIISRCTLENELYMEIAASALSSRISEAYPRLIEYIDKLEAIGERHEFLLSAICDIEEEQKNDAIYKCLKNAFFKTQNHMLGAVFLGDYGNPKAIPMLRKFAKDNLGKCSMDEYYTILAAIERLGGIIDDLLPQSAMR